MSTAPEDPPVQDSPDRTSFEAFVLSMGANALVHLGVAPHPETGQTSVDVKLARHTIDLLGMLDSKTCGNLTEQEQQVLQATLYDLRMRFIEYADGEKASD